MDVLAAIKGLFLPSQMGVLSDNSIVMHNFAISLGEVLVGVGLAAGAAGAVKKLSSTSEIVKKIVVKLTPLTYVAPLLLANLLLGWPRPSRITLGVILISFYPCMEVLWHFDRFNIFIECQWQ